MSNERSNNATSGGESIQDNARGNPHAGLVTVTIDNQLVEVPYGNVTVAALKEMLGVPPEKDLEEVKNNKLHPLNDKGHFEVKGGEVFISHPKTGMSS